MMFEEKQCNWQTFCSQNILGPFAPKYSCVWDNTKFGLSSRSSLKSGSENQRMLSLFKYGILKKLMNKDRQMQRFIAKQNTLAVNSARGTFELLDESCQSPKKNREINKKKLNIIRLRKVELFNYFILGSSKESKFGNFSL